MDVPDGTIRHQQSMLEVEVPPLFRCAFDGLPHQGRVFRMDPLEDALDGRPRVAVVAEDSKGLLRPEELAGGRPPAEAPRMAQPLPFGEIELAALLRALAGDENARGVLQRHRSQERVLVLVQVHERPPMALAARAVPRTRAWILAKAVSRLVEVLSKKGANPQSSVVPSCSAGMYSDASSTRSRTSSAVSTCGSAGAITPTKTRWSGFRYLRMISRTCRRSRSPA